MGAQQQTMPKGGLKGRHVLMAVIAFFGVVFAVNGVFLYAALATHSGLVANEPYAKGLRYNERIAEEAQQTALGWTVEVGALAPGQPLRLRLSDASGRRIDRIEIQATLGRPSTNRHDRPLEFAAAGDGFEAAVGQVVAGTWLLTLEAQRRNQTGQTDTYRLRRRLWIKP